MYNVYMHAHDSCIHVLDFDLFLFLGTGTGTVTGTGTGNTAAQKTESQKAK